MKIEINFSTIELNTGLSIDVANVQYDDDNVSQTFIRHSKDSGDYNACPEADGWQLATDTR